MKQDVYTLHKPVRRRFKRNRVIVGGIDQQWQMDLADMQSMQKLNDGYRYLLVCIHVFSKYAWVVPLKNKKDGHFSNTLYEMLHSYSAYPTPEHILRIKLPSTLAVSFKIGTTKRTASGISSSSEIFIR